MAHIKLQEGVPGIRGPMAFRPETAKPLRELVEVLLRSPHTLSPGEREAIATYVSSQNGCNYCQTIHGYAAAQYLDNNCALVDQIKHNFEEAPVCEKLKALLGIAGKVQKGGKYVTDEDIERARKAGASDLEIHDTVLIAAAFCMYNRYVDGLATWAPDDQNVYRQMADRIVTSGYTQPGWEKPIPGRDKKEVASRAG
jgi:uncharacterized peroxidase-related enzyme